MTNSSNAPRIVLDLIKTDYIEKGYIFSILLFIELYANIPMTFPDVDVRALYEL